MTTEPKLPGGACDAAGRALEAGYRAPLSADLTLRLVIVIILLLPPLLLRLAEGALPATVQMFSAQIWAN